MRKIILSRTDSIGDVVLSLPMAGILKEMFPTCRIMFLGRDYTRDIISLSDNIDEFVSWDSMSKSSNTDEKIDILRKTAADTIF